MLSLFLWANFSIIDDEDDWRYVSAIPADHVGEQKYFAAIGRSFFDLELSKEHHPFRILDVCTCSKSDQLFFQYYALALSTAFKWSEFNDSSNCHFTPCKEVCETPDFQFIPEQSNQKEVKKCISPPFFYFFVLYIPFFSERTMYGRQCSPASKSKS